MTRNPAKTGTREFSNTGHKHVRAIPVPIDIESGGSDLIF
jgi:hypothetical protein